LEYGVSFAIFEGSIYKSKNQKMKKLLLTSVLLLISSVIFSQNIEISGKIWTNYEKEQGKKFNPAVFITYDKKKNFVFKMSIAKIKKDSIKMIVFAIDPETQIRTHTPGEIINVDFSKITYHTNEINIGEIANSEEFRSLTTIKLKTDLLLYAESYSTMPPKSDSRFFGNYHFELNDTLYKIKLEEYDRLSSSLSKATKDYMTEETGSWSFDENTKELIFDIDYQRNKRYDFIIRKSYRLKFIVKELQDRMTFEAKKGILIKVK
jgi:hypothetical protein